jgi:hypothetical protein
MKYRPAQNYLIIAIPILASLIAVLGASRIDLDAIPVNPVVVRQLENRLNRLLRYLHKRYHKNKG